MELVLLAPIPAYHVTSALEVEGGVVAFGSGAPGQDTSGAGMWEFFAKLDQDGHADALAVMIYASRTGDERSGSADFVGAEVSMVGTYAGSTQADRRGRHPKPALRPSSALESNAKWSVFWHVRGLERLASEKRIPLSTLKLSNAGRPSGPAGIPRRPLLAFAP